MGPWANTGRQPADSQHDVYSAAGTTGAAVAELVATDPRHLRRGHAAHLMKHVLAEARATRLDRLECLSTTTAQSFYAGLGFMPVQNIDADIGGGVSFPVVKMQLPL